MRNIFCAAIIVWATPGVAEPLNARAIQDQLIGQPIQWWDAQGFMTGEMILLPSGDARLTISLPQRASDKGQWTLQGNQLCTVWATMRSGAAKCYTLEETEPGHFVTSGGNEFALQGIAV